MEGCSDNCYPGTTVLVNKLNIQNRQYLQENIIHLYMRNLNSTTFFTNLLGLKMWCC